MKLGICPDHAKNYELSLYEALQKGCKSELFGAADFAGLIGNCEFAVVVGVKNNEAIQFLKEKNQPFLYFDKPYNRKWGTTNPEWWRVSINDHSPADYLHTVNFSDQRARQQEWIARPWRESGEHVLIAGHSAKYSAVYNLPNPNDYAASVIATLKGYTSREILYRSKPSWPGAAAIEGAQFVGGARYRIEDDLKGAHAMVTHGSGACLEALLAGIPTIVEGPGIAAGISSRDLSEIENPRLAPMAECQQLLNNLAHFQWRLDEIRRGDIWRSLDSIIADAI